MQEGKVAQHITNWLLEYCKQASCKGFVVGVSGGIDSAVTSTLCAETGLPTLCVEMPIHQAASQVSRASEHIKSLQAKYSKVTRQEVELTQLFEAFKQAVPSSENQASLQLTLANTRARLRMTSLYYFAGLDGRLVAGTGNKIEDFGVGFYTKYGDGGVDISPIADLMKSEVFALGKHLVVSNDILEAAPTDGLFGDDRSDEDQLGASYDELEWAMTYTGTSDELSSRQSEVLNIYRKLNAANQHKMTAIPVCAIPQDLKS